MNIIYNIRKASGMSQIAFAKQIGVTQSAVSQYERGGAIPSVGRAAKIIAIGRKFNVTVTFEDICLRPQPAQPKKEAVNA